MSALIAFVAGVGLTPLFGLIGRRVGLVDRPGDLKIHSTPVPATGGVSVVVAVLIGADLLGRGHPWVVAGACIALVGGLVDDVRPLPPWIRLVAQAGAGLSLVAAGLRLEPFGALGAVALVVATMACCNAVNMVDGQDGLAPGLGAIAALGVAGVLSASGRPNSLALAVAGALAGFLVWNRPPARVYLGDGGAYAVGVLLAASAAQASVAGWQGVLASGACLGVFAYELLATVARRFASSTPAIRGDRDHSYDRLDDRLGSRAIATLVMWALGLAAALIGLVLIEMQPLPALALVASATVATAVLDAHLLPVSVRKEDR